MLPFFTKKQGAIAKRLCPGLQIRLVQFDSGSRLQNNGQRDGFCIPITGPIFIFGFAHHGYLTHYQARR